MINVFKYTVPFSLLECFPLQSTGRYFSKLQKMGLSCTDAEVDASWMREKETQITGLSESMKRSYWNETNFRTYQKLLKLQKETGLITACRPCLWHTFSISHSRTPEYFTDQRSQCNRRQQSFTAKRCTGCL